MAQTSRILGGILALGVALTPVTGFADQATPDDYVVSQDARFFPGQLVRADAVPRGIRTIPYAQYIAQTRQRGLVPRRLQLIDALPANWTIGVFR